VRGPDVIPCFVAGAHAWRAALISIRAPAMLRLLRRFAFCSHASAVC